jgi:hypothetical protein
VGGCLVSEQRGGEVPEGEHLVSGDWKHGDVFRVYGLVTKHDDVYEHVQLGDCVGRLYM